MPPATISHDDITAIVAYLEGLEVTTTLPRPESHADPDDRLARSGKTSRASPASSAPSITSASAFATSSRRSFFFAISGVFALVMRMQLATPNAHVLTPQQYNELFTMHGTTMIFLFNTPVLAGFGNYLVPLQLGARDMAFPRLNVFSYWIFVFGGLMMYAGFAFGTAPDGGWFAYAPLTDSLFSPGQGHGLLGGRRGVRRHLDDGRRGQLLRHDVQMPRAGHVDLADARCSCGRSSCSRSWCCSRCRR